MDLFVFLLKNVFEVLNIKHSTISDLSPGPEHIVPGPDQRVIKMSDLERHAFSSSFLVVLRNSLSRDS